mmetsp:Transcript_17335/g.33103  ORF Transcript_17335/g.33103 Transcript_17335/m.33103 type:complete len:306 (+) Transcript_17335:1858-2775(+)
MPPASTTRARLSRWDASPHTSRTALSLVAKVEAPSSSTNVATRCSRTRLSSLQISSRASPSRCASSASAATAFSLTAAVTGAEPACSSPSNTLTPPSDRIDAHCALPSPASLASTLSPALRLRAAARRSPPRARRAPTSEATPAPSAAIASSAPSAWWLATRRARIDNERSITPGGGGSASAGQRKRLRRRGTAPDATSAAWVEVLLATVESTVSTCARVLETAAGSGLRGPIHSTVKRPDSVMELSASRLAEPSARTACSTSRVSTTCTARCTTFACSINSTAPSNAACSAHALGRAPSAGSKH